MSRSDRERFKLLKKLGEGGFAVTHRARVLDQSLIKRYGTDDVALKIPHPDKEAALEDDFEINAVLHRRLRGLRDLNIVPYLGIASFRGQLVMAMVYMPDGNLRSRLLDQRGRRRNVPADEAVGIADGVLEGLAVLHSEQVFHRDIKPENILMEGSTPRISDFGISRMLDPREVASSGVGTLPYMAPEMFSGGGTFSSDIWSVGVTLYEMLAGHLPFGEKPMFLEAFIEAVKRDDPAPPSDVCAEVPRPLSDIVMRALKKRPTERFTSAQEMAEALKRYRFDYQLEGEMGAIRELLSVGGDTVAAERKLKQLVERYPANPRTYQYLGEFYTHCLRHLDAIAAFRQGLEAEPTSALLYWDLALAYQSLGRHGDVLESVEKALELGLDSRLRQAATSLLKVVGGGRR